MKYTIFLSSLMFFSACVFATTIDKHDHESKVKTSEETSHDEEHEHEGGDDHRNETSSLHFSETRLSDFDVKINTVSSGVISQQITLPGEVQLNREKVAHINPRFPAKVVKVLARTGDTVDAGQVLAIAESSNTLAQFEMTSLISGTVTNSHITLGEVLNTSDIAFIIADLSQLWVEVDLYPKHITQVAVGQPVSVVASQKSSPINSTISYVSPVVEEKTRTGLARVLIDNEKGEWKPGMFITATINLNEYSVNIALPLTAVINVDSKPTVFVQNGDEWEPRLVTLGRRDSEYVEVISGLKIGERYVAKGGFILKAHMQKGAFDDGHNH